MASVNAELWLDDVRAAMEWYESNLEFKWLSPPQREDVRHGEMQFQDSNALVFTTTQPGPGAVPEVLEQLAQGHPRGTGFLLLIEVDDLDIDSYYQRVTGRGVKVIEPLGDRFGGRVRMFRMEDPYGYILTFIKRLQPRG
ncbi:MAG TPA: VOC family protein [Dehalococcoidia bacterium]|nr:VOC family protein [Dehalococcoidia bacterium]